MTTFAGAGLTRQVQLVFGGLGSLLLLTLAFLSVSTYQYTAPSYQQGTPRAQQSLLVFSSDIYGRDSGGAVWLLSGLLALGLLVTLIAAAVALACPGVPAAHICSALTAGLLIGLWVALQVAFSALGPDGDGYVYRRLAACGWPAIFGLAALSLSLLQRRLSRNRAMGPASG